ncbi:MAG: vitamin K epoxide reductase family protein [Sulfolobales archaeon]
MHQTIQILVIISAMVGFVASIWGYYSYAKGIETPICRPGGKTNCLAVYSIPQAWILGFHLSSLAPYYYGLILILSLIWLLTGLTPAIRLLSILAWSGVLLTPYLVYLELNIARSICVYCTIMHLSSLIIAIATIGDLLKALGI